MSAPEQQRKRIGLTPRLVGIGGPASFQARLIAGLAQRGIATTYDVDDPDCATLLVTGGSYRLDQLWRARQRGVRIVQRLNGMNWVHRVRPTGWRHALRSEANNRILATIRGRLAHHIIYQSKFSKTWWERVYGHGAPADTVVYNGVDLAAFTPTGAGQPPSERFRLLLVEGHLGGGNEAGLENAVRLTARLLSEHHLPVELMVVGDVPAALRSVEQRLPAGCLTWSGMAPRERIPELDRSAHLLFSADINAACPNAVIEALACGLPVVSFDTGALGELLREGAGVAVPYGADVWKLEPPDVSALAAAAAEILTHLPAYRAAARRRAELVFGLEQMVDQYLAVLL
ncbi:MAG: glycosyltransferase family 4 protein [Anaerolineaceae bacterium]|nr:glycosyltransferase family 4 protein [Anaerolineaceae bacterium]